MKNQILQILYSETFNTTDQAGNELNVISDDDFNEIAENIENLFKEYLKNNDNE